MCILQDPVIPMLGGEFREISAQAPKDMCTESGLGIVSIGSSLNISK
jgi:hypothetical protein